MAVVSDQQTQNTPKRTLVHRYPWWCARIWHGMRLGDWLKLVARHRFRIHPWKLGLFFTITSVAAWNSVLRVIQNLVYARRVAQTPIDKPPVFIIGHWRSGTTYLHELMTHDDQFAAANSYECFVPHHFLLTQWLTTRMIWFGLPAQRPMDDVNLSWASPQEEEFALCNMGVGSVYLRIAFPNDPPQFMEYLDMEDVSPSQLEKWKDALRWFLQVLTFSKQKRLILKSPLHTGRIKILADMFPGVRFIHLVRNPYDLYSSNMRLWWSLDRVQGLQVGKPEGMRPFVLEAMQRMYRGFWKQRPEIDPGQICDVHYEDLVRDPVGQLRAVYEKLDLGDFEQVRPKIQQYAHSKRDYKTIRHPLDEQTRAEIASQWADYFQMYGYPTDV